MDDPKTKVELIALAQGERRNLEEVIKALDPGRLTEPGVENNWSIKDILAHIVAWEQRMCRWLEEAMRGEVPQRPGPGLTWDDLDQLNNQIFEANRDKSLSEVLEEFADSYQRAMEVVHSVPEPDLFDPQRYPWRSGDPLWHMVGGNMFWHYREHREAIQAWLSGLS